MTPVDRPAPRHVQVNLPGRRYDITIGPGQLGQLYAQLQSLGPTAVAVVTDRNVARHYLEGVLAGLDEAGLRTVPVTVKPGESSKSIRRLSTLYDKLLEAGLDRKSVVVALGGGVVGDLAGFTAATLLRGIRYVQVPTSLLAMVDSSVGGKVGINHKLGKNLVGAFLQPRAVLADTDTLATLPRRQFVSGMAEVIKYGVILDEAFFDELAASAEQVLALDAETVGEMVARCCRWKAWVVERDEKESGLRAILNYGHTFGHAVEALTDYARYTHGEAVALGMMAAGRLAVDLGMVDESFQQRQRRCLEAYGLPTGADDLDPEAMVAAFRHDKKASAGVPTFVLPEAMGRVKMVRDIEPKQLLESMKRFVND